MGAIRSAYSCPVFWREGQAVPDMMHWYFADKCAGKFPFRHSFQTHYQFDKNSSGNAIGEQPGSRPYSKGFGPIGATHAGLTWQGHLDWFVRGVPSSVPVAHDPCVTSLVGHVPFPPPDTYTDMFIAFESPAAVPSEIGGTELGAYHWHFESPSPSPGTTYAAEWFFSEGEGMVLVPSVFEATEPDGPPSGIPYHAVFIETRESTSFLSYTYDVFNVRDEFFQRVFITVQKCVPLAP